MTAADDQVLSVRLPSGSRDVLDRRAAQAGMTRSEWVRLRLAVDQLPTTEQGSWDELVDSTDGEHRPGHGPPRCRLRFRCEDDLPDLVVTAAAAAGARSAASWVRDVLRREALRYTR